MIRHADDDANHGESGKDTVARVQNNNSWKIIHTHLQNYIVVIARREAWWNMLACFLLNYNNFQNYIFQK